MNTFVKQNKLNTTTIKTGFTKLLTKNYEEDYKA